MMLFTIVVARTDQQVKTRFYFINTHYNRDYIYKNDYVTDNTYIAPQFRIVFDDRRNVTVWTAL